MRIIDAADFDAYWRNREGGPAADNGAVDNEAAGNEAVDKIVREIISAVRKDGDRAVRDYAARFDRSSPETLEVPAAAAREAWDVFRRDDGELAAALELSAVHIRRFAELQRKQFVPFESEMAAGLFTGQRVIPVERAALYVPAGRFPLFSSVLMGMIPALAAGVDELILASPPMEDRLPDRRILAAAALAAGLAGDAGPGAAIPGTSRLRIFAVGGAQAVAALALGTETVPRADVIAGPGNKYVAAAKRILFGEVGIDFVAGPTDVLIIAGPSGAANVMAADMAHAAAALMAADMCAQAEHDPDARARALVPGPAAAEKVAAALEEQLAALPETSRRTAAASLEAGGLIVVYRSREEAIRIANVIAPEHLELHTEDPGPWIDAVPGRPFLRNYGSLFLGSLAAEVLGDYSAGINHTLPTSGSARFTGGLSVRHFLKTPTTLRCVSGPGFEEARKAAALLGRAEGLEAHARSAQIRAP